MGVEVGVSKSFVGQDTERFLAKLKQINQSLELWVCDLDSEVSRFGGRSAIRNRLRSRLLLSRIRRRLRFLRLLGHHSFPPRPSCEVLPARR